MAPLQPVFDGGPRRSAAERIAAVCLAAAVVVGPVALGGTPTLARLALEAAVTAAVVLWLASGSRPLWAVLAPLAVAAIAGLQILPLPGGLLGLVSPLAAAAWGEATATHWGTVSVDPGATATGIRRLLLGLATVTVAADLGRDAVNRRLLVRAIAAAAVVVWTLGLVFPVDVQKRILLGRFDLKGPIEFWKTEIEEPVATGGTGLYEWVKVGSVRHEMPAWSIGDGFGRTTMRNVAIGPRRRVKSPHSRPLRFFDWARPALIRLSVPKPTKKVFRSMKAISISPSRSGIRRCGDGR